jgi:hypothetical protein
MASPASGGRAGTGEEEEGSPAPGPTTRTGVRHAPQARPDEARDRRATESTATASSSTPPVIMNR